MPDLLCPSCRIVPDPCRPVACGACSALRRAEIENQALEALRAWARADRDADDRAADINGIERAIGLASRPLPSELLSQREFASAALREACRAEEIARSRLNELAHRLLENEPVAPAASEVPSS